MSQNLRQGQNGAQSEKSVSGSSDRDAPDCQAKQNAAVASEQIDQIAKQLETAGKTVEQFIVRRPATAMAIAAASGVLLGLLVKRK